MRSSNAISILWTLVCSSLGCATKTPDCGSACASVSSSGGAGTGEGDTHSGGSTSGGAPGMSWGGAPASGGTTESGAGGAPEATGGVPSLTLDGNPPEETHFPATLAHFQLLPDTSEFTNFAGEEPFSITPLREENFPDDFDYCTAPGGDEQLNELQQFARARLKASLKTWYYDVTLISVPEEDGLTPYRLVIDGDIVAEFTTPAVGTQGAEDRVDFPHTWEFIPIEEGQTVEIWAKAHSNLEITEGANCRNGDGFDQTFAWARGRFNGLTFSPADL